VRLWYDEGIALVEECGNNSQVQDKLEPTIQDLQALLEENLNIASVVNPILEKLKSLRQ
jgi:hypothetical protein